LRRLNKWICSEGIFYLRQKIGLRPVLDRGRSRPPLLIVGTAQQRWELRREIDCLIELQPIAQGVEDGLKQAIGSWLIVPAEPIIQFIDPDVGELDRVVEAFEADGAHDFLLP
jgi:hypothetical protein